MREIPDHYTTADGRIVRPGRPSTDGLTWCGSGLARTVYRLEPGAVLKVNQAIDDDEPWCGDNRSEIRVWSTLEEEHQPYFAAILAADPEGRWLVQEEVEIGTGPPAWGDCLCPACMGTGEAPDDERTRLRHAAAAYAISDLHGENVGRRHDGTPCIVDYAFLPGSSDDTDW